MPRFAAAVAESVVSFAFAFGRLRTFTGGVPTFAALEAAFALPFALALDEIQLTVCLWN